MEQECSGQQAGRADHQNFRLDLIGEEDVLLNKRGARKTVEKSIRIAPRELGSFPKKVMWPAEVPLHQCTEHGKYAERGGSCIAVRK